MSKENVAKIKAELTEIKIFSILKKYLLEKNIYSSKEIEEAFSDFNISVKAFKLGQKNAKQLCNKNSIYCGENVTYASLGVHKDGYWANPQKKALEVDWFLLLDDTDHHKLHVFKFSPGDLPLFKLEEMKGKTAYNINVRYGDSNFIDTRSRILFRNWLVKTIEY